MPEPKRPLKVFLCHAHADRDPVRGLYARLTKDGVDAWLDKEKLLPGQDWELEIRKAVREADVVVVCLSKQFNQAGFRQKEVRLALDTAMEQPEGEIFIIPARLEECETLESLRKWHWVDLFEDNGYEMLMRALRARAQAIDVVMKSFPVKRAPKLSPTNPANAMPLWGVDDKRENSDGEFFSEQEITSPSHDKSKTRYPTIKTEYIVAIIGAAATIFAALLGSPIIEKWFSPVTAERVTATSTITLTPVSQSFEPVQESDTPTLAITPTISYTLTVTPLPTEITDDNGVSLVLVPEGEFIMGSDQGSKDETPSHRVTLDAFYIDKYEVTNAFYKLCVDSGKCTVPKYTADYTNLSMAEHPILYVSWELANAYCEWRGARLPSEAEWEKAARGTDGRTYPWTGEAIDSSFARFAISGQSKETTLIVGSKPKGKSPYGAYDMAGNVWEWVADRYLDTYYDTYLIGKWPSNPKGPTFGDRRVLRGGGWNDSSRDLRTTNRLAFGPTNMDIFNVGIRCAKDAAP